MGRLRRILDLKKGEERAVLLAPLTFFLVLGSYYVLRPLREEMGLAGGVRNLPWLFSATLLLTLVLVPVFGALISRFSRRRAVPYLYQFFALNLLGFYALLHFGPERWDIWIGRAFYAWLSAFNMFAVSVFWASIVNGFAPARAKRLFGLVAAGGSFGALIGSVATATLVGWLGREYLLLLAVILLQLAILVFKRLDNAFVELDQTRAQEEQEELEAERQRWRERADARWQQALAGIGLTLRSPYLLGLAGFLVLYSLASTFLYFQQAHIVEAAAVTREARTTLFAQIDMGVNGLTLLLQILFTGRLLKVLGPGKILAGLSVVSGLGFAALAARPTLGVLVLLQLVRRSSNYALVRPARESLFTALGREEKYKAKSFVDTFVYRGGDALGAAAFDRLVALGWAMPALAATAIPVCLVGAALGHWLGRRHKEHSLPVLEQA